MMIWSIIYVILLIILLIIIIYDRSSFFNELVVIPFTTLEPGKLFSHIIRFKAWSKVIRLKKKKQ